MLEGKISKDFDLFQKYEYRRILVKCQKRTKLEGT